MKNKLEKVTFILRRHIRVVEESLSRSREGSAVGNYLTSMRNIVGEDLSEKDALELVSQHIVIAPILKIVLQDGRFLKSNSISVLIEDLISKICVPQLSYRDLDALDEFYDEVREEVQKDPSDVGKQRLILKLFDQYFRKVDKKVADKLGIVYTPVEVVDFIINSVNDTLVQEFGTKISGRNVCVTDPFTGTGTFITRLMQVGDSDSSLGGLLSSEEIRSKYINNEVKCYELVLLAYYIASINIESTFLRATHDNEGYQTYTGATLTDTFAQDTLSKGQDTIQVIIGNPPYSARQRSGNDNNANDKYESLDKRIQETYAKNSTATNLTCLYDSYIRAIRWANDSIGHKGVVAFVVNGGFIESKSMSGLRKSLIEENTKVHVVNLRGNLRKSGRKSKKEEGGNIFDVMVGIAIIILVKNPAKENSKVLFYKDVGTFLTKSDKLNRLKTIKSGKYVHWDEVTPDKYNDWVHQRDLSFNEHQSLDGRGRAYVTRECVFEDLSNGVSTSRDSWVVNFDREELKKNVVKLIDNYNAERVKFNLYCTSHNDVDRKDMRERDVMAVVNNDDTYIKWSSGLISALKRDVEIEYNEDFITTVLYRPYQKAYLYNQKEVLERTYQTRRLYPYQGSDNISIGSLSGGRDYSVMISNLLIDKNVLTSSHHFPMYLYETKEDRKIRLQGSMDDIFGDSKSDVIKEVVAPAGTSAGGVTFYKRHAIQRYTLNKYREAYGEEDITREDIFYYTLAMLSHPEYKSRYVSNLQKELPRLPQVDSYGVFILMSSLGRRLAQLHLNYEDVPPHPDLEFEGLDSGNFKVDTKGMKFPRTSGLDYDYTSIKFNEDVTVSNVPEEALYYEINGTPVLELIMARYKVHVDKRSGIVSDANKYSSDPKYIFNLLCTMVNLCVKHNELINELISVDINNK